MRVLSAFVLACIVEGPNGCAALLAGGHGDAGAGAAPAVTATTTGAQHAARAQQLEADGRYDEASKEYDAAAERYRAEGNLEASADARRKSAAVQQKIADQLVHGAATKPGLPPAPAPAPVPAAAPAPLPATGGIANGLYLCHGVADNGFYAVVRRIQITGANYLLYTYNDRQKLPGTYRLDGTKITWLSGPLAGHGQGDYKADDVTKGNMVLVFIDALTPTPGAHRCYVTNSAPPP